ncbi:MAG: ABC transporter permease [Gammaproteobacteria bacterium]|nr:ABC transporter permease [Gammaproteobacteria bacterium]
MQWFIDVLYQASIRVISFDISLYEIVGLTLLVSLFALIISVVLALPVAAWLSLSGGLGGRVGIIIINSLMSFPPVLAGLLVYMLLSRRGPLGDFGFLFTPTAMVVAQVMLIFPIICGLSEKAFREKRREFSDLFFSLGLSSYTQAKTIIVESRYYIFGALVSGLGRGLAEVGAVMIVGGNIAHHTRTITTTIALETSKGDLVTAVSLGLILMIIALGLNIMLFGVNRWLEQSGSVKA